MAPVKKATSTTAKKASSHPTFLDMIQVSTDSNPEPPPPDQLGDPTKQPQQV